MENTNKWELFIGIAAIDKPYNSPILRVYVTEIFPFSVYQKKTLDDNTIRERESISLHNDEEKIIDVKTSNVITANYLNINTNRMFPPDIRKGEYVLICRYMDSDEFYWIPLGLRDNLRRLEQHRISVSNSKEIKKELDEDNTYYIELDTLHKKSIVLRTSKSDGELFRYIIHIDAKKSEIHIEDDDDNYIILKSKIPMIKLHNKNNTFLEINKNDMFIHTPRDLRIKVERMIYIKSQSIAIDNDKAIVINSNNIGLNARNVNITSPTIGFDGNLKVTGVIVAGAVRAGDFGTGGVGGGYPKPKANTDITQGTTTTPTTSPDTGHGHDDVIN